MSLSLFKLEKLKIQVFATRKRSGMPQETFLAMFNPESYSRSHVNVFNNAQAINSSSRSARYSMSRPENLTLKIVLDGTGVIRPNPLMAGSVSKEVERFLELTSYMDGDIHEPRFLTILWGDLHFKCRLKSVTINYTLFDNSGLPLRAELDTVFVADLDDKERIRKENKNSPDLTHRRMVRAHDTLPLMCEKIYGSAEYVTQVARANDLDSFRDIAPGQELYFPPLET